MLIEECFEYNQHFVAMMNIINLAKKTNLEGKFESHHVIPKCFYRAKGLEIDNSPENLVNLTYEQHQKVHELAVLCAKKIVLTQLRYAANMMNNTKECRRLGGHPTEETRTKMCDAQNRPEVKAKRSASLKGHKVSDETRAKISDAQKGKKHGPMSDEQKAKISAAMNNPEAKAKMSAALKISNNRPETRAKRSASLKGNKNALGAKRSVDTRARMSAAKKGRHWHIENGKRVWSE